MAGLPYDLMKSEIIAYLNSEYPDGITVAQLRNFRSPGPRRDNISDNRLYTLKTQLETTYGCNEVSRKAIRSIAAQAFDEGLLSTEAFHPLDLSLLTWHDDTTLQGSTTVTSWDNHSSALGGSTYDYNVLGTSSIGISTLNGLRVADGDGTSGAYIQYTSEQNIGTGDITFLIVYRPDSTAGGTLFSSSTDQWFYSSLYSSLGDMDVSRGTSKYQTYAGNHSANTTYAAIMEYNTSTFINTTVGGLGLETSAVNSTDAFLVHRWFDYQSASDSFDGKIACIGIKQGILTSGEKTSFLEWASTTHGALI
jgi:hypothetical protein